MVKSTQSQMKSLMDNLEMHFFVQKKHFGHSV